MTFRSYLWGMRVSTVLALVGWILVILYIDPEKSGIAGQMLFYGSTFLLFSGLFILFFTWVGKSRDSRETADVSHIGVSFRQGILLALLALILLFFQQSGILTWWDGLLATAGIFLVELFFLSKK